MVDVIRKESGPILKTFPDITAGTVPEDIIRVIIQEYDATRLDELSELLAVFPNFIALWMSFRYHMDEESMHGHDIGDIFSTDFLLDFSGLEDVLFEPPEPDAVGFPSDRRQWTDEDRSKYWWKSQLGKLEYIDKGLHSPWLRL